MKKRLTSILLALAMVASLLPAMDGTAKAADDVYYVNTSKDFKNAYESNQVYQLLNGTFILQQNVTMKGNIEVSKDTTIDLNGCTMDLGDHSILVWNKLTLKDSKGGGKITGGSARFGDGGCVYVARGGNSGTNGVFIVEGGTIINNHASSSGGGVYVAMYGTLVLKGGIIKDNTYGVTNAENNISIASGGTIQIGSETGLSVVLGTEYTSGQSKKNEGSTWVVNGDVEMKRSVTLNANGGSVSPASTTITYGNPLNLPTPTRSGYTFNGWYTAASGGTKVTSSSTAWGPYWVGTYYARWTANPATVTTAPTAKSLTYSGSAQALVNAGTASNGTMYYKLSGGSYSTSIPTATNAGTYTVYYQAQGTGGNSAEGSVSVTIGQKEVGLSWSNTSFTYDGGSHVPTATATGLASGTFCTVTVTGAQTNAGTHTATASSLSNNNYKLPSTKTTSFTISKANINPTLTMNGWTYGETAHTPSVSGNTGGGAVTYTYQANKTGGWTGTKPTTAGTHTVKAVIAETTNYNGKELTKDFTISKAGVTPTVSITGWTYGDSASTPSVSGNPGNGGVSYTYTGTATDGSNYSSSATPVKAGSYTVTATVAATANYNGGTASASFTIEQRPISGVTWGETSFTYNGSAQAPTATATGLVSGDSCTVNVTGAAKNAGTHTATVSGLSNANYKLSGTAPTTSFTIGKAPLTITAENKSVTYGDAAPAYSASFSGLQGDSITPTFSCEYTQSSGVGSYTITPSAASGNYEISFVSGTLTVTQKEIGIEWGGTSFTYDGTEKLPAASATGAVNGDALTLTVVGAQTNANAEGETYTASVTGIGGENSGNYVLPAAVTQGFTIAQATVDMSGAAWDYSGTFTYDGTEKTVALTGLPEGVSVVSYSGNSATDAGGYTASAVLTYTDTENYVTPTVGTCGWMIDRKDIAGATVTLGGELTYTGTELTKSVTSVVIDGLSATYTVTGNAATNAGDYTLTVSGTDNFTGTATAPWSIAKRDITGADITLGTVLTYDGTEQTQALASVTADGVEVTTYTLTGNTGTGAGDYTLTVEGTDNFTGTASASWSIARKSVAGATITLDDIALTYNGTEQTKNILGVTISGLTPTYAVSGDTQTDAGDYDLTITGTGNFTGEQAAPWSIAKAALTVTAKDKTIVKGDAPDNDGVTYSGFVNGENESVLGGALAYAYDTDGSTAGGGFTITPSGLTSGNYAITYVPGTLTVKDTYAVTYHRNYASGDGEITETQRKVEDTALTLSLPAAARTGYTLDGWFSARSGGTERTEANYTDNAALALYAHWTPNSYTVKFNANGGAGEMDDMAFTYDAPQALTANAFTRSAYNFVGWARAADGAVEWNDGATAQNLTAEEDGTFTLYAVWTAKPVYTVSGTVVGSDHTPIGNVAVKLMRGNEEIASTITATDGMYVFNAPADTYNIVATWQKDEETAVTKTQLVVLNADKSYELVMPNGKTNSVLELKGEDTPPVVVGGLDDEAAAVKTAENDDTVDAKKITVTMTVESKDETEVSTDATAIKTAASGKTLDYLAITVEKDVDGETTEITTTTNVLEIVVPYDFAGKQTVEVYRYHGTEAEAMTALDAQPDNENPATDGTFRLDKENGLIYIYAKNFSTYAIGYTVPAPVSFTPTVYPPEIPDTPHGALTVSPTAPKIGDKVTVTPKPDEGFAVDTVTVTGPDGKIVPVTDNGDGTYTFTQPSGKVKIEVTFKAVGGGYADCAGDASCPISAFTDTDPAAWYHDGVHWALENGVMSGVGGAEAGKFGPNDATSRAMMAQILWNLEGQPEADRELDFTDLENGKWYLPALRWTSAEGIIGGYGNGLFGPDDRLTREQLVTIIYRYAKKKGINVSVGEDTNILSYDDAFTVSEWAIPAMQWAVGSGAVLGRTDTTLDPKAGATRAEIATIIMRYCTEIAR